MTFTINNQFELANITLESILNDIESAELQGLNLEFPVDADMCKEG